MTPLVQVNEAQSFRTMVGSKKTQKSTTVITRVSTLFSLIFREQQQQQHLLFAFPSILLYVIYRTIFYLIFIFLYFLFYIFS